ncbi:hypothetical protein RR48_08763 [Papilio machaon]|uniref:Uncharacterized protein n=1 Tax=Papilio machaon TaxID=76193 RepID=A0A194RI85_PAPMA|nr:hypothetical protein RR48_08763 [Papilio machaon]
MAVSMFKICATLSRSSTKLRGAISLLDKHDFSTTNIKLKLLIS